MSKFSSGLRLAGLDDFIAPSQDCIKPIETVKPSVIEGGPGEHVVSLGKASISLTDCLACSGCVTSAESVLITSQGPPKFFQAVEEKPGKRVVVSISPQARASLAAHYGLPVMETHRKLISLFKSWGAHACYDSSFTRIFTVLETRAEFLRHYRTTRDDLVPLLSSSCPGWICYAEKRDGEFILPFISKVKSPQQIMGSLVKTRGHIKPDEIFHVSIMPCYDKKLEASRDDFYNQELSSRDVDLVLTSGEVLDMITERCVDFKQLMEHNLETEFTLDGIGDQEGSGGYAADVFKHVALVEHGVYIEKVEFVQKRNSDFHVATLNVDGKDVLRVAKAYGFRNIQNIVRSIKHKKNRYHYVEIMACPSGCLNGGGQIKEEGGSRETAKETVKKVHGAYSSVEPLDVEENEPVAELYSKWIYGAPGSAHAQSLLYTQYHAIPKMASSELFIKW